MAYCNHFVNLDYYAPYFKQMTLGIAQPGERAVSLPEQRKTEIYNDYFVPQDKIHNLVSILVRNDNNMLLFAAQRGKRAGAFGERTGALMNILAPHVTRAVQVHRKLGSVTVEKEWALGALDHLRVGVILTGYHCSLTALGTRQNPGRIADAAGDRHAGALSG